MGHAFAVCLCYFFKAVSEKTLVQYYTGSMDRAEVFIERLLRSCPASVCLVYRERKEYERGKEGLHVARPCCWGVGRLQLIPTEGQDLELS